jgi:hypothetical protein
VIKETKTALFLLQCGLCFYFNFHSAAAHSSKILGAVFRKKLPSWEAV